MAVKVGFTGDFCPQGRVEKQFLHGDWHLLFAEIRSELLANDLNVVDLECPLVADHHISGIAKTGPHLKCLPETVEILKYLNVSLVATANNHFMDYGIGGMLTTYTALKKSNIDWVGSGNTAQEAATIYFKKINDVSLAIINAAENEWSTTNGPYPGVNTVNPIGVFKQLQKAKQKADFTIIIVHGGNEHYNLPSPRIKELYRFFIDSGASAVISHHTHTVSGYEVYKDCPIFYGLGNFCFDWPGMVNKPWNIGMLVQFSFSKNEPVSFNYKLFRQNDFEPGIAFLEGKALDETEELIKRLNKIISDDRLLSEAFDEFCLKMKAVYDTWLEPYDGKLLQGLRKRKLLPSLLSKRKKRLFTNIIRCESHRDVLLYVLEAKNDTQ